jgi:hypothetical protein
MPPDLDIGIETLATRKRLRERLKCHDFDWYLRTVAIGVDVPPIYAQYYGEVRLYMYKYYRNLDRELNSRHLAYGNTASIKGTMTLTAKPNPLHQKNRRFNDQGRT